MSPQDLIIGDDPADVIGEGGQAVVRRGKWKGVDIAAKMSRNTRHEETMSQMLRREVRALARVRHPNVVRLYGACLEPVPTVVMALAPSGTLQDALDAHRFQGNLEVACLLAGIARGMEAVHAHALIHLDLKPENVLIGPLDVPWITDFGLSTSTNQASMSVSSAGGRGMLPFKAPELFVHPPTISQAADVYAFAMLSWVVIAGEQPYSTMQSAQTSLPAAVRGGERPILANGGDWRDLGSCTNQVAKLIEACWASEHTTRPLFGGAGAEGVVSTLETLENSMAKASDERSQLSMVTRLIAAFSEAQTRQDYMAQIDEAISEASPAEKEELDAEREGASISSSVVEGNATRVKDQLAKGTGGSELVSQVLAWMQEHDQRFNELKMQVESHDMSLTSLTAGELGCPRLFLLLPVEDAPTSSLLKGLVHRAKGFVKDKYRLVFLDPVTGCAVPSGPEGDGYQLTLPSTWLVEHRNAIADGIKVFKAAVAMGKAVGLPLPGTDALPKEVVSKQELEAVEAVNTLMSEWNAVATGKAAATGQAYKMLRKVLDVQCNDKYLEHCSMQRVRAKDGTIEFVSEETKARFISKGKSCLIWNTQAALAPSQALRVLD